MATTMATEILSMNELDRVSGGTWKEYFEIANLLPSALLESRNELGETYFAKCYMYPKEVEDWLNKNLGIWANIDAGSSFKSEPQSRRKNSYMLNGESVTHSKVIAEIHNFLGK